jgi:uncharacterized protein YlzI (FlbEa/FlbD family)
MLFEKLSGWQHRQFLPFSDVFCFWKETGMIKVKQLNGEEIVLNENYIESIEAKPDTTIHIHNGTIYVVMESIDEILQMMQNWKQGTFSKHLT